MLEVPIENSRAATADEQLKIPFAAKLQDASAAHVEFPLHKRNAELVRLFQREKRVGEFARSLPFAQVCNGQAGVAVLALHASCRERDPTRHVSAFLIWPRVNLSAEHAAGWLSFLEKPCDRLADVFRRSR